MVLTGKKAIITGGSRGIGKATALLFAAKGAEVAVVYGGDPKAAEAVCAEIKSAGGVASAYRCDVADFTACERTTEKIYADFGKIDILVNNAGITRDGLVMQMSEADFDAVMAVNLKGAFNMIRHTARRMAKQRTGRIVNISSVSGMMGNPGQANYASAKAGMIGLTKTVAKELAPRGVTCNAIAPGFIKTDMTAAMPEAALEAASSKIPLGRMGEPGDIAQLAAFLASDAASYITGEVIKVDGGLYI